MLMIAQNIPIIGQHFVKEIPPSDNVCTSFLYTWFAWMELDDGIG